MCKSKTTLPTSIKSGKVVSDEKIGELPSKSSQLKAKWQLGCKILELVLCALCIGFLVEPTRRADLARIHLSHFVLILPTFCGYLLIALIFLITKIIGDKIPYRTGFMFSFVASSLFFVCGVLLALDRKDIYDEFYFTPLPNSVPKLMAVSITLSFFTSMLFGVEAFFIFKCKRDF